MKLFRRDSKNCDSNNAVSPEVEPSVEEKTEPVAPPKKNSAYTPKKGYATPRRRDVERARGIQRGPVAPAPMTRKEARAREDARYAGMTKEEKKAAKAREREERRMQQEYRRERMAAGDDDYVLPRDKGPVRRFARDWVDSNWTPISWLFPVVLFLLIFTMIPNYSIQRFVQYLMYFCFIVLLVETFRIALRFPTGQRRSFRIRGRKKPGSVWDGMPSCVLLSHAIGVIQFRKLHPFFPGQSPLTGKKLILPLLHLKKKNPHGRRILTS